MKSKKIKIIIAQSLIVSILLPSLNVKAINNNNEITNISQSQDEKEKINTENVEQKDDNNEKQDSAEKQELNIENKEKTQEKNSNLKGKKYEKNHVNKAKITSVVEGIDEDSLEYKLMLEATADIQTLIPMTDDEYELALAYSDGSYEFINSYNDLNEAINYANNMPQETLDSNNTLPAIINNSGQVIYSTNEMARITKYENNNNVVQNINIYSTPQLKDVVTYVNPGYVSDAPILEYSGTSAKVLINGREGWISNNRKSGNYDMEVIPLNQVSNPSYYRVSGGQLYHYISSDLTGNKGNSILIGVAPSYLKEGIKYLSYDGTYFYAGSNIQTALSTLISDYKSGIRSGAVNSTNPHSLYYQNLSFRSKTLYSADELNRYIDNNTKANSKLRGLGQAFKEAEEKYGVNALLMLAVAMNESAGGVSDHALLRNNLFGVKAYDGTNSAATYASPVDSVLDFSKNYISNGYSNPNDWRYNGTTLGNKYIGINVRYASDPFWGEKASSYAYRIDNYLSGVNSDLRDTNSNKIAYAKDSSMVINKSGQALYKLLQDSKVILNSLDTVTINGAQYYEINPDTNFPKGTNYDGSYNWDSKGYVPVNSIARVNVFRPGLDVRAGDRRYDTAVELSKSQFNTSNTIVIAGGYALADGLTATPIASHYKAPLLLVEKNNIPEVTKNEIKRLGGKNIIIVGGNTVISSEVEKQLLNLGVTKITRLGGSDRYETSLLVAQYIDSNLYNIENIVVTNGLGEADALSISPVAGRDRMPIILVRNTYIPTSIYNWLRGEGIKNAYIIGGTTAINNDVLNKVNSITSMDISGNRLGGSTRYETNAFIIDKFYGSSTNKVYVSKGLQLIDALSSGPIAALENSPVILANNELTATQRLILSKRSTNVVVQSGHGVSKNAIESIRDLLSSK
ncbi:MAG: cell wall-binding repeat-containing protein [Clostridium sp.]|uniref:cell wall-binding repeat-containing protein n=1 Tax=Clostridium sp. TaxID=1506 RepID=UPI0025B8DDE5|nr:cell wall-binding repeat-containing protein [Clostridium sp.]MCF0147930.1 cell wall-binding repeat-containing protein [Clostridium sp.]